MADGTTAKEVSTEAKRSGMPGWSLGAKIKRYGGKHRRRRVRFREFEGDLPKLLMIFYKLSAILFSLLFLLQAYLIKRTLGSYLIPAALFSVAWFLFTFIPLVLLFSVPINPLSILYIFMALFTFSMSAIPFNWQAALKKNSERELPILATLNSDLFLYCLNIFVVLALACSLLFVLSNGFSLELFQEDFIQASARYASLRGNEYLEYGVLGTLSTFFTYLSAVVGGFVVFFRKSNTSKLLVFLLAMTPSIAAMAIQSAKLTFFIAFVFYLASALLMRVYSNKRSLFDASVLSRAAMPILLIAPFVILSFISREGYSDFNDPEGMFLLSVRAVKSYLFGSLYAFGDFFAFSLGMESASEYRLERYQLGYFTFKGVFDSFGGTKVFPAGFYWDFYMYKDVLATNIFSIFRELISDFGYVGGIAFMYPFGLFFHFMFYRMLVTKNPWFASAVFIMFVAFVSFSFLLSIFTARYVFLVTGATYLLLTANEQMHRARLLNVAIK